MAKRLSVVHLGVAEEYDVIKRILGILLALLGAIGILACVLGCVYAWRAVDDVTSMADDTLILVSETLDGVQQSLAVVSATLDSTVSGIDSVYTTTLGISETLNTTRLTLGAVADLAEEDLAVSIESTMLTLQTLEQTAGLVDEALKGLSLVGIVAYKPEASLRRSVAGIRAGLEPVPETLGHVGSNLGQTAADLGKTQRGIARTGDGLLAIREDIAGAKESVARYADTVQRWQGQVSTLRQSIARTLRAAGWGVTLLLTWIGLSQLAVVHWGASLIEWSRDQARAEWAKWKQRVEQLRLETWAVYLAYRDPRTPWYARIFAACVVGYALSPIDLIPDFIPILGHLDDLILVPLGIALALKMIPRPVMTACRERAREELGQGKRGNWRAGVIVVITWLLLAALAVFLIGRIVGR